MCILIHIGGREEFLWRRVLGVMKKVLTGQGREALGDWRSMMGRPLQGQCILGIVGKAWR